MSDREFYKMLKGMGLCPKCHCEVADGHVFCAGCRAKALIHSRKLKAKRIANGLCVRCSKPHKTGRQKCVMCLELQRIDAQKLAAVKRLLGDL